MRRCVSGRRRMQRLNAEYSAVLWNSSVSLWWTSRSLLLDRLRSFFPACHLAISFRIEPRLGREGYLETRNRIQATATCHLSRLLAWFCLLICRVGCWRTEKWRSSSSTLLSIPSPRRGSSPFHGTVLWGRNTRWTVFSRQTTGSCRGVLCGLFFLVSNATFKYCYLC